MPITRHFLNWDRSILEAAGDFLMAQAGDDLLDLSDWLVIVPTRNAGRRLREVLAHLADEQGKGILPPQVVPPEFLLSLISEPRKGHTAKPEESLLAWTNTLLKAKLRSYGNLFPVEPVAQDFQWAMGTAQGLTELRRTLGESGLEIEDVLNLVRRDLEEMDRWRELARLEKGFKQQLAKQNLIDVQTVRKLQASSPEMPEGISRIAIIGTPDPVPLTLKVLRTLSDQIPTEVLIFAPDAMADHFDELGRPTHDWADRPIEIPDFQDVVTVLPDSMAQAEAAADLAARYAEPCQSITLGVMDEEIAGALERHLTSREIPSYNPQGSKLQSQGIVHFFCCLRDLMKERSVAAFVELLRCPDYDAWLSSRIILWNTANVFEHFDKLCQKHLPQDLRALRHFLKLGKVDVTLAQLSALDETDALLTRLEKKPLAVTLPEILHEIFSQREIEAGGTEETLLRIAGDRVAPLMETLSGPLGRQAKLTHGEQLDFIIHFLKSEAIYDERDSKAVELLGWLELLWDDAPHLAMTGFNDGFVPEAIIGDIYLPEQLRCCLSEVVDLTTNDRRYARDVYLLEALLNWRRHGGRVDVLLGKHTREGDPLRPSRLLFRCAEEELPARAEYLFSEVENKQPNLPWAPGFLLKPSGLQMTSEQTLVNLPVTAFRDYLSSPLRFYLRHIEKMDNIEGDKVEMGVMDFGNFCHEVLLRFGREDAVRNSVNEAEIKDFLFAEADRLAIEWFGYDPALPVQLQLTSAKQRLSGVARVQARDRQAGWVIEQAEYRLSRDGADWTIGDVIIRGTVDRIDRNEKTNEVRILDYKTSDKADDPLRVHMVRVTSATNRDWLPAYAEFAISDKDYRWKDLQLPLYRLGLRELYGEEIRCGYFNLPKSHADTDIALWRELGPAHDEAALTCAQGVIEDVMSGKFWPPGRMGGRFDDYALVHLNMPERTIDPANLHEVERVEGEPSPKEEVAPEVGQRNWRIAKMLVTEGDWVEEGEEIVELDADGNQVCVIQATQSGFVDEICVKPGDPMKPHQTVFLRLR